MRNAGIQVDTNMQNISLQDTVLVNEMKGRVKFIGETQFAKGIWYGIELDKPLGKNDGSVNGIRYFDIDLKKANSNGGYYGLFCKKDTLQFYKPDDDEHSLLNGNAAQETIKNLQVKCESLASKLNKIKIENHELKTSVEKLSTNETVLLSKISRLDKLVKELKVENGNMKTHLDNFNHLLDASDSVMAPDLDKGTLLERSHLLQRLLDQTKLSYDKAMKVQEDLLEENTQLLEENAVLSKKISDLGLQLQQTNNTIGDLALQIEAQSKSSNIVDKLTNDNILLTSNIKALNNELEELQAKEKLDENLRNTYEQLEQELRLQLSNLQSALENEKEIAGTYIEENSRLKATLESIEAKTSHKFQSLELKVNTLQEELYQNKLLKKFYQIYEPFAQPHLAALSSQLQYLAEVIESENFGKLENIEIHIILKVLSSISYALHIYTIKNTPDHLETTLQCFKVNIAPISMWLSEFLQRKFSSKQETAFSICQFLEDNKFLDKDVTLILKILHPILETTVPKLLAFLRTNSNFNDNDTLCLIGSLYERSLSLIARIDKLIGKEEISKQDNRLFLYPSCDITLSSILTILFSDALFLRQDYKRISSLKKLEVFFQGIESLLENITIFPEQPSQQTSDSESQCNIKEGNFSNSLLSDRLNEENIRLKEVLVQKENMLTELETKIKIIIGRDLERKTLEENIKTLKVELNNKNEENCGKTEILNKLKEENFNLVNRLKNMELKLYQIKDNNTLNKIYLDREKVDRVNLVSEIMELRETIRRQIKEQKRVSIDFSWLDELPAVENKQPFKEHINHSLDTLGIEMFNFVSTSRIIDLKLDQPLAEDELWHERDHSYISYLKRKRKNIRLKSQNVVTYYK
ncbi:ADE_G0053100.mRNA.1.CDS.1 [Saccharomyces cerevisiae]|nr:Nip100p [Saccharomyces cerevisiae YJM1399]CAI4808662.1 CPI_1c_G0053360.mRNA.1.CDS.1 [Saccharomyces cerevisiae]CAI4832118.1 ADE_G0053100.mRNA.1.CDS.1 [Saccharomyces cerevisiae]CAI6899865.1 ADE_G0053100.mRNA.1.CDS.1 [Saccharomyces cerevisiae]CAI7475184.1 CPI_1c_G0053360.mRNA.1.CDS.1 [Saccharomyces cerevisiae]